MKIYIAGKITGDKNYKGKFSAVEEELKKQGHAVLNPAVLSEGFLQAEYIHICKAMIDVCDAVYFLKDWMDSKGAKQEMMYAISTVKELMLQR